MKKNIEDYVFHKKNFLDDDFCEKAISDLNTCKWKKHGWYIPTTSLPVFENIPPAGVEKESEVIDIEMMHPATYAGDLIQSGDPEMTLQNKVEDLNDVIIKKLRGALEEYVRGLDFYWFSGWEGYTGIKFIRYFPGQEMKVHCDHIHSMFDGVRKGVPILSIIGHLNDDYEGGETYMFDDKDGDLLETEKGDLYVLPSCFLFPHYVTPVTKGTRYSYVSWVW